MLNSHSVTAIIHKAYTYKKEVIELKTPMKFLSKEIKYYTQKDFENDLVELKKFDINLLWNKSFWKIGTHSSICAIATQPYTQLKFLLKQ